MPYFKLCKCVRGRPATDDPGQAMPRLKKERLRPPPPATRDPSRFFAGWELHGVVGLALENGKNRRVELVVQHLLRHLVGRKTQTIRSSTNGNVQQKDHYYVHIANLSPIHAPFASLPSIFQ
ncbi:hypothetical protein ACSS6W_000344 [Trichoderma asperelloides]